MFGPQCYQRSDYKGKKMGLGFMYMSRYTHTVLRVDKLKCLESPRWDLRRTFLQVCW